MRVKSEYPRIGHITDPGQVRSELSASAEVVDLSYGKLLMVAAALGNDAGSREAGLVAVDAVASHMVEARVDVGMPDGIRNSLREAFLAANRLLESSSQASDEMKDLATSLVAVLVAGGRAYVANAGIARLFLLRKGEAIQVTRGVNNMGPSNGQPGPSLPKPLGVEPNSQPDILAASIRFEEGDALLLCSSGLYEVVELREVVSLVGRYPAEVACIKLVDKANERGGPDSIAIVAYQHSAPQRVADQAVKLDSAAAKPSRLGFIAAFLVPLLAVVAALAYFKPWVQPAGEAVEAESEQVVASAAKGKAGGVARDAAQETALKDNKAPADVVKDDPPPAIDPVEAPTEKQVDRKAELEKASARTMEQALRATDVEKAVVAKAAAEKAAAKEAAKAAAKAAADARLAKKNAKLAKKTAALKKKNAKLAKKKAELAKKKAELVKKAAEAKAKSEVEKKKTAEEQQTKSGKPDGNKRCVTDGLGGKDTGKIKAIRKHVMSGKKSLKIREGSAAAKAYKQATIKLSKASVEVKQRCEPLVDELRVGLYQEYLRLAKYFVGRGKCGVAVARANDARTFDAPETIVKMTLSTCYDK